MSRSDEKTITIPGALDSTLPVDAAAPPPPMGNPSRNEPIAGRYRLRVPLGSGGHGAVWEAEDQLSGDVVALKLLNDGFSGQPARVRREIAALRLLRLPGVVRLLDEGLDRGRAFLVMEHVDGLPFPGTGTRTRPWSELAGMTIALLETLGRVHATGVVHRDLKPGNVLVSPDGRPMLLDFGISHFTSPIRAGLTLQNEVVGTPAYLAPEQITGDEVTGRTDLYALGVMLYEALSGQLPHAADNVWRLLQARLTEAVPPLARVAPDVPAGVAAVIDQLLRTKPGERPRSAAAVLSLLQGVPEVAAPAVPRFGPDAPLRAIVDAGLHGRARRRGLGAPGLGSIALPGRRRRQAPAPWPSRAPRGPGDARVREPRAGGGRARRGRRARPEAMALAVVRRLTERLAGGAVLLVDDADRIDAASAAAIARCHAAGAVVEARIEPPAEDGGALVLALGPVNEEALRALFEGPDRLLHLQEDAARALWARTDGLPARVADELTSWVRAGLTRWEGDRLVIDRDAIERLEAGLPTAAPQGPELDLEPHLVELLGWIELAATHAQVSLLARVLDLSPAQIEARVAELVLRGAARTTADGRLVPCTDALEHWPEERRQTARLALAAALPRGASERLLHLVGASDPSVPEHAVAIACVAGEVARRLAAEGHLGKAALVLGEGLRVARLAGVGARGEIDALLELWVEIGLAESTPGALDRVLHELHRTLPQTPVVAHLEQLVRAALATLGNAGEQALAAASAVPPFARTALETRRQALRVSASRLCPEPVQEAVLDDAAAWARGSGDACAEAAAAEWQAHLRYRQGHFDEAADLYGRAAQGAVGMTERVLDTLLAASSLMEAFRHAEAAAWASAARDLARDCRHAYAEGRAEWILRTTAYRSMQPLSPDIELFQAVAHVGVPGLEAVVSVTEAAVALRSAQPILVRVLAKRAHEIWVRLDREWLAFFARCLEVGSGEETTLEETQELAARALACPEFGFGIQAIGLLSPADPALAVKRSDLDRLAAEIPRERWNLRMDVLSVAEVLAGVRVEDG